MMFVPTIREKKYEVISAQSCTVTALDGTLLCRTEPGTPAVFTATAAGVFLSDASAVVSPVYPLRLRRENRSAPRLPLVKYAGCTDVTDMKKVKIDYVTDVSDGVWSYALNSLENGDSVFVSVVALHGFTVSLPRLKSGRNMFAGCILSLASVQMISRSVPAGQGAVLTLGIDIRIKNNSELQSALDVLEQKGWVLEIRYNTPIGVPTLAELEYLESPAEPSNFKLAYFALPLPDVISPRDSLCYETEHLFTDSGSILQGEGCPMNLGCFLLGNASAGNGVHVIVDGILNHPGYVGYPLADWLIPVSVPANSWHKIKLGVGSESSPLLYVLVDEEAKINEELNWSPQCKARKTFFLFGSPSQENDVYKQRTLCGKKRYAKIWVNDELLYDMVPVLDELGVACMFDKLSGQYFYNQGAEAFKWELKSSVMSLRSRTEPLLLPRSPIIARMQDGSLEWCHYRSDTTGWESFPSVDSAQEILGK